MALKKLLLREKDVVKITAMSRATLWRLRKLGIFPEPKVVGLRTIVWSPEEVHAFCDDLAAGKFADVDMTYPPTK